jgi:DNA-directed RNA polymerase subunit RPC12/RpoP
VIVELRCGICGDIWSSGEVFGPYACPDCIRKMVENRLTICEAGV